MGLHSTNVERLLLDKARSLSGTHISWRCIHIDFSAHKDQCSEGLRTHIVTNIIKELLESEEGNIYLCEDGDVFILFQGKVKDILDKLGEHFKGLGTIKKAGHPDEILYTVFDLSSQWDEFFALCEKKVTALTPIAPAEKPKATASYQPLRAPDAMLFEKARARRASRKQLRVLIVEDDPFTRRLVAGVLKGTFDIIEAGTAADAITAYETYAPDAVFLDIELPDSNGHIVLNRLMSFDRSAFVVMLSANSLKENILAALEKGAQGFVAKPFAKEKLLHYLNLCETARHNHIAASARVEHHV